jgi:hypothetical protein
VLAEKLVQTVSLMLEVLRQSTLAEHRCSVAYHFLVLLIGVLRVTELTEPEIHSIPEVSNSIGDSAVKVKDSKYH